MDKLCEDCVHNEICRYDAICITGHCNDKETLDDLRPKGEWIYKEFDVESGISHSYWCSNCGEPKSQWCDNFCQRCGADMRGAK